MELDLLMIHYCLKLQRNLNLMHMLKQLQQELLVHQQRMHLQTYGFRCFMNDRYQKVMLSNDDQSNFEACRRTTGITHELRRFTDESWSSVFYRCLICSQLIAFSNLFTESEAIVIFISWQEDIGIHIVFQRQNVHLWHQRRDVHWIILVITETKDDVECIISWWFLSLCPNFASLMH